MLLSPLLPQQLRRLCLLREIIGEMMTEINGLTKNSQISVAKKQSLEPLAEVLRICLEERDGICKSLNILIDATFRKINSQKFLPLMDGLTRKFYFFF